MEADVLSLTGGRPRRVKFPSADNPQTPPICCSFAEAGGGEICYHSAAAIIDKHGVGNLYKFVNRRDLTSTWKEQYAGLDFELPSTADIEDALLRAEAEVDAGTGVCRARALLPPRGRPTTDAGVRLQPWCERGPGGVMQKRKYT